MPDELEFKAIIDRELERLHGLLEQGKEVFWCTQEISRLNRFLFPPPMIMQDCKPGDLKWFK